MIIDINASLGHYPFRRLRYNSAQTMIQLMDRHGIDRAVVSSLHAIFYRDAHRGNEDLYLQAKDHAERLVCLATVNPRYVGWERDLEQAVRQWNMKAATLVPAHHGYKLSDDYGHAAMRLIAEMGLPLVLTQRFEDRRQRHHWDVAEDLETQELYGLANSHPTLRLALVNWIGLDGRRLVEAGLKGRILIDFARMHFLLNKDVPKLMDELGAEAIAFGTHMPVDYVGPSLVKLANMESLGREEYEQVAWRNAANFFGLKA